MGHNQQALYCYRKLYNLDPTNTNALWDRAALSKEIGELRTVRRALRTVISAGPSKSAIILGTALTFSDPQTLTSRSNSS